MGLFSVLDIILDKPMEEALECISISKDISDALVEHTGELYEVLNFIKEYENASWQEVSRLMILGNIDMNDVYNVYLGSLSWYRELINL